MADKRNRKDRKEKSPEVLEVQAATDITPEFIPVVKDLAYTKAMYEPMLEEASRMLDSVEDNTPADDIAALYSIYYESMAGLIRSGVLCSRASGKDGFPEIRIVSGNNTYSCRALESKKLEENPDLDKEESLRIRQLKSSHKKELNALKKSHDAQNKENQEELKKKNIMIEDLEHDIKVLLQEKDALNDRVLKMEAEKTASQSVPVPVPVASPVTATMPAAVASVKDEDTMIGLEDMPETASNAQPDPELVAKVSALEAALAEANSRADALRQENLVLAQQGKEADKTHHEQVTKFKSQLLRQKKVIEEHEKYVYDPNYDHYYNDELPQILDSIDFTRTDLGARGAGVALCVAGIVVSLLFII